MNKLLCHLLKDHSISRWIQSVLGFKSSRAEQVKPNKKTQWAKAKPTNVFICTRISWTSSLRVNSL